MVGTVWTFRRGDTEPQRYALERRASGGWTPADLTGATIRFLLRALDLSGTTYTGTATLVSPTANGQVDIAPGASVPVGDYQGELEVTYSGGKIQTFPTTGPATVRVVADLG